jgi:uncharacterized membrane protein
MDSLETRVSLIEERLSRIEKALHMAPSVPAAQARPAVSVSQPKPAQPQVKPQPEQIPQPQGSTGNLLGIIGIVCFVFAAAYIVKLAIDSGWLTPVRQVLMAGMLGVSMIGAGLTLRDRDEEYISFLPAGGILVLFLTILGATNYHQIMSPIAGTVAILPVAVFCLFLYKQFKHFIYQIIATVGAFLIPLAFALQTDFTFTNIYYVIASLTFSAMAVWVDQRAVSLLSAYMSIGAVSFLRFNGGNDSEAATFIFIHFMIYVTGTVIHSVYQNKTLTRDEATGYFPLVLFFYALEYYYLDHIAPDMAPWFSVGLAAILMGMYFLAKSKLSSDVALRSGDMIFSAALCMLIHSCYFVLAPEIARPAVFLALAFAFGEGTKRIDKSWTIFLSLAKFLVIALFAWNYFNILVEQAKPDGAIWLGYGFLYAFAMFFYYINSGDEKRKPDSPMGLILFIAHGMSIMSLYNLVRDYGSLAVSVAWLAYGIGILGLGYSKRDTLFAKSSIVVLLVAAVKAMTWDMAQAAAVVRVVCLLLTGGLLYVAGLIFRRIDSWKN